MTSNGETEIGYDAWRAAYEREIPNDETRENRSGIEVKPLYTRADWDGSNYDTHLGLPGAPPYTRGIYTTMHRGRTWTQRQLIGLGTPADYNSRVRMLLDAGSTAISLLPCNSGFRGIDCDEVDPILLGTCGTVVNNVDHMDQALGGVPLSEISTAMNDPSPFTLHAFLLVTAERRGTSWSAIRGTSNQSDYLSHYIANHMFYRIANEGSRRILTDHVAFCHQHVPAWNPISVVGQHMQQAGATPAEAMGLAISTGLQYVDDCVAAGLHVDDVLARLSFFFDISISFFEEVAKLRAGRRIWARVTRDRLGARDPKSWRMKFHGQTSGVDLTRQQPLNNIARVTAQAMAGIFGGLQSLHTDAYDEVIATPNEDTARIAVATQNILREEAGLVDVIDPLAGSYYVESLTDQMEEQILEVMATIDAAGGMFAAAEQGIPQEICGDSAMAFARRVDTGQQSIVGVNRYRVDDETDSAPPADRPDPEAMAVLVAEFVAFKTNRSANVVAEKLDALARSAHDPDHNIFGAVIDAARSDVTHGEIVHCLREELGFGHPLAVI